MFTGGKPPEALLSPASIHIVTHESQLPSEFLYPSPEKQFIIGFDCEGVDLCRYGTLCIMQVFLLSYIISRYTPNFHVICRMIP